MMSNSPFDVCAFRRRASPDSSPGSQPPPEFQNEAYEPTSELQVEAVDKPENKYETLSEATLDRRDRTYA